MRIYLPTYPLLPIVGPYQEKTGTAASENAPCEQAASGTSAVSGICAQSNAPCAQAGVGIAGKTGTAASENAPCAQAAVGTGGNTDATTYSYRTGGRYGLGW